MANWQEELYKSVPWFAKEWLVSAEAIRRNYYQRYGNYDAVKKKQDINRYYQMSPDQIASQQSELFEILIDHARIHSPFYRTRLPKKSNISELKNIPILTKQDIRNHGREMISENASASDVYKVLTSGSTGTPLLLHLDRCGVRDRYAVMDNYLELYGCSYLSPKVRFAGAKIKEADSKSPPFWIYNRPYRQLQMSPYHLDLETFPYYLKKINQFQPEYCTGYAHAYFVFAQFLQMTGEALNKFPKAIITDSEGILPEQREIIELSFQTKCYSTYGLREVSPVALHCREQKYHVMELNCVVEVLDDNGNEVPDGVSGRIIVTDLLQKKVPYIRYDTGDIGRISTSLCACGFNTSVLESIDGRLDDVIVTPLGRKISRVSHIVKPGYGILESQIAQTDIDRISIRIVPAPNFDPRSMSAVLDEAHALLGKEMRVEWELVKSIQRTKAHKFKHVVSEIP